jgi:hypothetical protein
MIFCNQVFEMISIQKVNKCDSSFKINSRHENPFYKDRCSSLQDSNKNNLSFSYFFQLYSIYNKLV